MPPLGRYGQSIAELMMRHGENQSRNAMRSGMLWAGAIQGLGNAAGQAVETYQQREQDKALSGLLGDPTFWDEVEENPQAGVMRLSPYIGPERAMAFMESTVGLKQAVAEMQAAGEPTPELAMKVLTFGAQVRNNIPEGNESLAAGVDKLNQSMAESLGMHQPGTEFDGVAFAQAVVQQEPVDPASFEYYQGLDEAGQAALAQDRSEYEASKRPPVLPLEERAREKEVLAAASARGTESVAGPIREAQAAAAATETAEEDEGNWGTATTDAERKRISSSRYALRKVPTMQEFLKKNRDVIGPVEGRVTKLRQKWGPGADYEIGKREAELAVIRNAIVNALSGVAVNPQEFERIKEQIPNITDTEPVFEAKLAVIDEYFREVLTEFGAPVDGPGGGGRQPTHFWTPQGIRPKGQQ